MGKSLLAYSLIAAVGVTGAVGDVFANKWAKSNSLGWIFASYALWIISVTLLGYFLRLERFTFSSAIFIAFVVHATITVFSDLIYFGGRLSKIEWLGIGFAVVAILLLEAGRKTSSEVESASTNLAVAEQEANP